jgi:uncharacterized membrane protein YfcA
VEGGGAAEANARAATPIARLFRLFMMLLSPRAAKLPYEARWRQPAQRTLFEGETKSMLLAILVPLSLAILLFSYILIRAAIAKRTVPNLEAMVVGVIVNFFDTLGIGSFAPTAAWMKFRKIVPDRLIPPTMLVGLTPPSIVESIIFLILLGVLVDPTLLIGCSLALLMGGLLGAPLVARSRVWVVQTVVAVALVLAAVAYAMTNLHLFPGGGTESALPVGWMTVAIAASFVFGVLLNFGVGNYAPQLVMLSLMGMDPRLCFPIMAGGAALTGAGASIRHVVIGEIDLKIVLGLAIGGIPAVLVAAFIVKTMPLDMLRWLVIVVVLYAAAVMARAAFLGRREHRAEAATAPVAA